MVNNSYWRDFARLLKKSLITTFSDKRGFKRSLCGQEFWLTYESRKHPVDREYYLLQRFALRKSCILDVGLNVGITSLIMSTTMSPTGRIFGFEASVSFR
jgi:hypothetical protein